MILEFEDHGKLIEAYSILKNKYLGIISGFYKWKTISKNCKLIILLT